MNLGDEDESKKKFGDYLDDVRGFINNSTKQSSKWSYSTDWKCIENLLASFIELFRDLYGFITKEKKKIKEWLKFYVYNFIFWL